MFILFFLAWVIFNGNFTLEIAIFGLIFSCLLMAFIVRFMDYKLSYEIVLLRKSLLVVELLWTLIVEIFKSNGQLIAWIFMDKYRMEPALVTFSVDLKSDVCLAILASCITLTPGTITTYMEENVLTVHCLDKELSNGIEDSSFVRILRKMEAK